MYQVSIQRDDREGREDREEVEVDKGNLEVQQNPPAAKRTWLQTAKVIPEGRKLTMAEKKLLKKDS